MNLKNNKDEFVRLLGYKSNLIRDSKQTLLKKYASRQMYEQFLKDTKGLLDTEAPIFLLDDDYIDKVQSVIASLRFDHKDKKLNDLANEIITELNELKVLSPERENDIIDEFICMHEDIRELEFLDLQDFINTIAQDIDAYLALLSHDTSPIDSVVFIGTTNYFLAAIPSLYEDEEIVEISKTRAQEIKKTPGIKGYNKRKGANRMLSHLEEVKK